MTEHDSLVEQLAELVGIAPSYMDAFGKPAPVSLESRRAVLSGLGLPVGTADDTRESLARVQGLRRGLIPPLVPVESRAPVRIPVRDAAGASVRWRLVAEGGTVREGAGEVSGDGALHLPPLPSGYHFVTVEHGAHAAEATIIAAPRRCWEPKSFRDADTRLWGVTAQVYGLRSERNLGIGDYSDVAAAAEGAGALGASFLGLSPVHALFASDRTKISPYSPSSRLFLESIFIDPTAIKGFAGSKAASLLQSPGFQQNLQPLRDAALIDHAAVWSAKEPLLEALWADVGARAPDPAFAAFRRDGGDALQSHALFEALHGYFFTEERWWLGDWPPKFRDVNGPEVRRFAEAHPERVAYHAWLQWVADEQLGRAAARARAAGMGIGLYRDLAVGGDPGGSEIWAAPERFAATLSVGAPPDILGPHGQNWGLPPFDPLALERQGLAAFRALVTANMRHAGAIRIDHAFQLQRLFLIPPGATPAQGAYVDFPFEAMLAVLRLESHRWRCLVIAEDLGTAPVGFSDAIMASGLLSYRILSFEREPDGAFKRPEVYPRSAMAALNTHDLPTFRGWWRGLDIDLRQTFGVADVDTAERERAARAVERRQLAEALNAEGILASPEAPDEPPVEAAFRYLARTPSALMAVQFEDASGEIAQANMPGLDHTHPNWKRRLSANVDAITAPGGELAKLSAALAEEGRGAQGASSLASPAPRATYRIQFHKDFTFDDAVAIVPYLARLGVSHLYASPIHTARPGSTHGYDIVDHAAINPELGGEEGFRRLSDALEEHGLGLILDIVPNHMGVGGADNGWWLSVLEWGALSPHGHAFDIDWERLGAHGKLVVPFLGDRYGEALEKGTLKLAFDPAEGAFSVWHYEHRFPVSPLAYPIILDRALVAVGEIGTEAAADLLAVSERLRTMGEEGALERRATFPAEGEALKRRIASAVAQSPGLRVAVDRAVTLINGRSGLPESFGTLHRILEEQAYRLAHWRVAASDINYRRFFDINGLAGIRVELPDIFAQTHAMVAGLVRDDRIGGLRIDHIDGLADPEGYTQDLQRLVGPGFYVVVEKILEPGERLRPWPISGTTGYDVMTLVDGVFVDTTQADAFERIYRDWSGLEGPYAELLIDAKTEILARSFASELEVLVSDLKRIADADRRTRDYTVYAMRIALTEIVARFPVYRSYLTGAEPDAADVELVRGTIERAKKASALPDRSLHDFVTAALLGTIETDAPGRPTPEHIARFRRRFQQLTGPVMAKSFEDTLFYRYVRLLSLNEVGGDPERFGISPDEFHRANIERAESWPHTLIASATHDTKRGEDARGRLNALSQRPEWWGEALEVWAGVVAALLPDGAPEPDANDQYLVLQTLLGAWPLELLDGDDVEAVAPFRERVEGAITKALREAKRHTSWVNENQAYEGATLGLVRALLVPGSAFLERFRPLARRLAYLGMLSGLARTALKCTLPGIPDVYQGTEFWDFSLVDPDNRRPVDYDARMRGLEGNADLPSLLASWRDGRIKQRVLADLLADRAQAPSLYAMGGYAPVAATGRFAPQVLAFSRRQGDEALVVAVPRLVAGVLGDGEAAPLGPVWGDTALDLSPGTWRDVVTGREITAQSAVPLAELFADLPIAVLRATR